MKKKDKKPDNTLSRNKKAFHDYHIIDTYEAGIELLGTEVKSCRDKNISLLDSYARIDHGNVILCNVHISQYKHGNRFNHEPLRPRQLLLHKHEIRKLIHQVNEKGNTLIPLQFYLARGKIKVEIAVAKGKKQYDKRESLRKAQDDLEKRRAMKH